MSNSILEHLHVTNDSGLILRTMRAEELAPPWDAASWPKRTACVPFESGVCKINRLHLRCNIDHEYCDGVDKRNWKWTNARIVRPLQFDVSSERAHFEKQQSKVSWEFSCGNLQIAKHDEQFNSMHCAIQRFLKNHNTGASSRASDLFVLLRGRLRLPKLVADLIVVYDALNQCTDSELFDMCRYAPRQLQETMCLVQQKTGYEWQDEIALSDQADIQFLDNHVPGSATQFMSSIIALKPDNKDCKLRVDLTGVPREIRNDLRWRVAVRFEPCFYRNSIDGILIIGSINPRTALVFSLHRQEAQQLHTIQLFLYNTLATSAVTVTAERAQFASDHTSHYYCLSLDSNATMCEALSTRDFLNCGVSTLALGGSEFEKLVLLDADKVVLQTQRDIAIYWRCGILCRGNHSLYDQ